MPNSPVRASLGASRVLAASLAAAAASSPAPEAAASIGQVAAAPRAGPAGARTTCSRATTRRRPGPRRDELALEIDQVAAPALRDRVAAVLVHRPRAPRRPPRAASSARSSRCACSAGSTRICRARTAGCSARRSTRTPRSRRFLREQLRPLLVERAPGPQGHDRLRRRPQDRAHDHRQQRALRARRARQRARRAARPLRADALQATSSTQEPALAKRGRAASMRRSATRGPSPPITARPIDEARTPRSASVTRRTRSRRGKTLVDPLAARAARDDVEGADRGPRPRSRSGWIAGTIDEPTSRSGRRSGQRMWRPRGRGTATPSPYAAQTDGCGCLDEQSRALIAPAAHRRPGAAPTPSSSTR